MTYSQKSPGSATSSSRQATCQTRAQSRSNSAAANSGLVYRARGITSSSRTKKSRSSKVIWPLRLRPVKALAPPLAEVPLPARNVRALLERNATDEATRDRPALRFGNDSWTHAELLEESRRYAALMAARLDPSRPPHVGVLLDNTPDYVFTLCGAGLLGAVVVGLNHTRRDEHLAADIAHTDVQFLVTEPRHLPLL